MHGGDPLPATHGQARQPLHHSRLAIIDLILMIIDDFPLACLADTVLVLTPRRLLPLLPVVLLCELGLGLLLGRSKSPALAAPVFPALARAAGRARCVSVSAHNVGSVGRARTASTSNCGPNRESVHVQLLPSRQERSLRLCVPMLRRPQILRLLSHLLGDELPLGLLALRHRPISSHPRGGPFVFPPS